MPSPDQLLYDVIQLEGNRMKALCTLKPLPYTEAKEIAEKLSKLTGVKHWLIEEINLASPEWNFQFGQEEN